VTVRADVPNGARKGVHIGPVAVRESGPCDIDKAQHVNWTYRQFIQRADAYGFAASAGPLCTVAFGDSRQRRF
jgi:hypothetical protein